MLDSMNTSWIVYRWPSVRQGQRPAARGGNPAGYPAPVQRGERLANGVFGRVGRELACESDDPDPRVVKQRGERPVGLIRRDTSAPNAEVDIDMDVQAAARHITCHEAGHLDLADQPLDVDVGTRKVK